MASKRRRFLNTDKSGNDIKSEELAQAKHRKIMECIVLCFGNIVEDTAGKIASNPPMESTE